MSQIKGKQVLPNFLLDVNCPNLYASVAKYFRIPHPTKKGYNLTHSTLEGPEIAIFVRGVTKKMVIDLPTYWKDIVHTDSITVHLTPIGRFQALCVQKITSEYIYVTCESNSNTPINYSYIVYGTRKDVPKLIVEEKILEQKG